MPNLSKTMRKNDSLCSIRQNLEVIKSIEERALNARSLTERIADGVGAFCGSMKFVVIHLLLFGTWILINVLNIPPIPHFDPYPFMFMSMAVSLEAIFLSTFVLIKQNRMSRRADTRAALDLQINLLAEKEMTMVLRVLMRMSQHMGLRDIMDDEELAELVAQTPVEAVAEELEQAAVNQI